MTLHSQEGFSGSNGAFPGPGRRHFVWACVGVYAASVLMGLFALKYSNKMFIDYEILETGSNAVAFLDGSLSPDDIRVGLGEHSPQEPGHILLAPPIAVLFHFFGDRYLVLQVFGVFLAGLWSLVWFVVTVQVLGRRRLLLKSLILVVAIPLIQMEKTSLDAMTIHMGASAWFGLALALFFCAQRAPSPNRRAIYAGASGFVAVVAFFWGQIALPLVAGMLLLFLLRRLPHSLGATVWWGAFVAAYFLAHALLWPVLLAGGAHLLWQWRGNGGGSVSWWWAGCLAGMALLFMIIPAQVPGADSPRVFDELSLDRDSPLVVLWYFGGVLSDPKWGYSALSGFYSVFMLVAAGVVLAVGGLPSRIRTSPGAELTAFAAASAVIFILGTLLCRTDSFDGLRYYVAIAPFYLIGVCFLIDRAFSLGLSKFAKGMACLYILYSGLAYATQLHPFEVTTSFRALAKGYSGQFGWPDPDMESDFTLEGVEETRRCQYAQHALLAEKTCAVEDFCFGEVLELIQEQMERPKNEMVDEIALHVSKEMLRGCGFIMAAEASKDEIERLIESLADEILEISPGPKPIHLESSWGRAAPWLEDLPGFSPEAWRDGVAESRRCDPWSAPDLCLLQGIAMGATYCAKSSLRERGLRLLKRLLPPELHRHVYWGAGRALIWGWAPEMRHSPPPEGFMDEEPVQEGIRAGIRYDLMGRCSSEPLTAEEREAFRDVKLLW